MMVGPAVSEGILLLRSLRVSGNTQPIVVMTNGAGEARVRQAAIPDVEFLPVDERVWTHTFRGSATVYGGDHCLGPLLGKIDVLQEAARRHGSAMYLDADMVVLRRYYDVIEAPVALTPELPRAGSDALWRSRRGNEIFGLFNAGCVYLHKDALFVADIWRKDFLRSWPRFRKPGRAHGCFLDQSSLDLLSLVADIQSLHPGHNLCGSRIPAGASAISREAALATAQIVTGSDLYFRGWPVVSLHTHFHMQSRHPHVPQFFRDILRLCANSRTNQISHLISDTQTPAG